MAGWKLTDMLPQDGRVAIVTGANSGLGLVTARSLAGAGAHVVLACRNAERAAAALERLRVEQPSASVEVRSLDLADLASVERFADAWSGPLHLLLNNAGLMAIPYQQTAEGFEMQFGTNHLGHFALTSRLMPALLAERGSRVVTLSSEAHRLGRIEFDDLQSEQRYQKWRAYGQSKLANLLFARELSRRASLAGSDLLSVAAHPGYASTNLQQAGPAMRGSRVGVLGMKASNLLFGQSDVNGAVPVLYGATGPALRGGEYLGPDGLFSMRGDGAEPQQPSKAARDDAVAKRLWDVSEDLTGVRFEALRPVG
jgi:NAD(P)-dependent dehydrogenase (short-subunit alcohol dehydrogenase family)